MSFVETEEEESVNILFNFVKSIEPSLSDDGDVEGIEEMLVNLETTDENFHRYDFVRRIREKIEFGMGASIDDVAKEKRLQSDEKQIPKAIAELVVKDEYLTMTNDILKSLKSSSEGIVRDVTGGALQFSPLATDRTRNKFFDGPRSIGDDSFTSSFDAGAAFMFMSYEKYDNIANNLNTSNRTSVRMDALNALSQIPQADIAGSETWPKIKRGLLMALADDDDSIVLATLQFYARAISAGSALVAGELYTSFVEHLLECFSDNTNHMVIIANGMDLGDKRNVMYMKKFRLLNQFQLELPVFWIRYPEKVVEAIIKCTVDLLSLILQPLATNKEVMLPMHFLSLIDPKAAWFRKWIHGHYSRSILLNCLNSDKSIVTKAVIACFEHANCCFSPISSEQHIFPSACESDDSLIYSHEEILYAHLVHSFHFLGQLIIYKNGRHLFPIHFCDPDGSVTVEEVIVSFIHIMCANTMTTIKENSIVLKPPRDYVSAIVVRLASTIEQGCSSCVCTKAVIDALLVPIEDQKMVEGEITETVLLRIAEVLASLACCTSGQLQLLYAGSDARWQCSASCPAGLISEFTVKGLQGGQELMQGGQGFMYSAQVTTAFLFVCRQLYNTCEGLFILYKTDLSGCLANAMKVLCHKMLKLIGSDHDNKDSPIFHLMTNIVLPYANNTPLVNGIKSKLGSSAATFLEMVNLCLSWTDNLLNFTATPKGVLLVQQTGLFDVCVSYMFNRYKLHMQVSKTEKYGYGVIINQVTSTPAGMAAMNKTGVFEAILDDVWRRLDGNTISQQFLNIDYISDDLSCKSSRKLLVSLVAYLSGFEAVLEHLATDNYRSQAPVAITQPVTSSNSFQPPKSFSPFVRQCVTVDDALEMRLLTQFELAHLFGLTVVNALVTCLDTGLLLQTKYSIVESLVKSQLSCRMDDGAFIIDPCALLRNQLLVRFSVLGGPDERILPPETLPEHAVDRYAWPLFADFPIPSVYLPTSSLPDPMTPRGPIDAFVSKTTGAEQTATSSSWLPNCKASLFEFLADGGELSTTTVFGLLSRSCLIEAEESVLPRLPVPLSDDKLKAFPLSDSAPRAVALIVNYGHRLGLLKSAHSSKHDDLTLLLRRSASSLETQREYSSNSYVCNQQAYRGFDWFVGIVFLLYQGNTEEAWKFLQLISGRVISAYVWVARMHNSVHLPNAIRWSGVPLLNFKVGHNIELILHAELPQMASAFRLSGCTPSQITQLWLRQCFLNFLNWREIRLYLVLCLVAGPDYQIYCCLALMKHLERKILDHSHKRDLILFLKREPIVDFRFQDYIKFMSNIQSKYRDILLADLNDLANP